MDTLELELKHLIVDALMLKDVTAGEIDSEAPLMVEGLGLDSIDALELAMAIGKRYGVKVRSDEAQNRVAFSSVRARAGYIRDQQSARL